MSTVEVRHPDEQRRVLGQVLWSNCTLFQTTPSLLDAPYSVKSDVSVSSFRVFISALEGSPVNPTSGDFPGLSRLCDEFGFPPSRFSTDVRFTELERHVEILTAELSEQTALNATLSRSLDSAIERIDRLEAQLRAGPGPSAAASAPAGSPRLSATLTGAPPAQTIDSLIVTELPPLFNEFDTKKFRLLWRGSRDGFSPLDFHNRCDGHPNTLLLIQEIRGYIFGGFTPVRWERGNYHPKGDETMKSFLFSLRNPHNTITLKFPLREDAKGNAIWCYDIRGPGFGGTWHTDCDLQLRDNCSTNRESSTAGFGLCYKNDLGVPSDSFFTGSPYFTVKEVEVFEVG
jgi:hypothetical protein